MATMAINNVALLVSAWIEIGYATDPEYPAKVALLVSAWIEMQGSDV